MQSRKNFACDRLSALSIIDWNVGYCRYHFSPAEMFDTIYVALPSTLFSWVYVHVELMELIKFHQLLQSIYWAVSILERRNSLENYAGFYVFTQYIEHLCEYLWKGLILVLEELCLSEWMSVVVEGILKRPFQWFEKAWKKLSFYFHNYNVGSCILCKFYV